MFIKNLAKGFPIKMEKKTKGLISFNDSLICNNQDWSKSLNLKLSTTETNNTFYNQLLITAK